MFEKLGGRKLFVALAVGGAGMTVAYNKGDIPVNLLQLLEVIMGAFMGSNIMAQYFGTTRPVSRKPDPDDEGSSPPQTEAVVPDSISAPEPQPGLPQPVAGIDPQVVYNAFMELGQLIDKHAARSQETTDAILKATAINQQALSVITERVVSMGGR